MGIRNLSLTLTAQELRNLVEETISKTIDFHRASRSINEGPSYQPPNGAPTDEEINDFIFSNALLDEEIRQQLTDPGLLGFSAITAQAAPKWLAEFKKHLTDWSQNNSWLAADLPWVATVVPRSISSSQVWYPENGPWPSWISSSPTALILAADLLRQGRLLSDLPWRKFEELIGQLLEAEGWSVEVTKPTKDGGVDVLAQKDDPTIGSIRSLWQAKKYGPKRNVRLCEVRELGGILEIDRATKGVIVTTSRLTKDALEWIRRDKYRLDYKDAGKMETWIRTAILG
jgi:restriction system protein